MLMEIWDRYRRLILVAAALVFAGISFALYESTRTAKPELPLTQPAYAYTIEQNKPPASKQEAPASPATPPPVENQATRTASPKMRTMYIDIKGQVKKPGIYPFLENERIADAIEKAGGFLPGADTIQVNLAQHLADGMYIIVPAKGSMPAAPSPASVVVTAANASLPAGASVSTSSAKTSTVNLNTATADQLTTLPGIGKTRAEAIIAYREQHGRFTQIEQLTKITGIGSTVFERIKGQVSVE